MAKLKKVLFFFSWIIVVLKLTNERAWNRPKTIETQQSVGSGERARRTFSSHRRKPQFRSSFSPDPIDCSARMAKILRIFLFLHCFSDMLNIQYVASPVSVRSQKGNVCSLDLERGQVFNEMIWSEYSETLKMNQFWQSAHRLTMNRKIASHTTPPPVSLRETTSEKQLQKFHDDVLLPRSG